MMLRSITSLGVSLSQCLSLDIFVRLSWRRAEQQLSDGRGHDWWVPGGVVAVPASHHHATTLIPNLIPTCDGRALMGRRESNQ